MLQIAKPTQITMSSLDFLVEVINPARESVGETPHEPRKFLAKVEDELDLDGTGKKIRLNNNQTESAYYDLTMDQLMLVGMRESKAVRRSVLDKLKQLDKPVVPRTYAEALLEAGRLAMEVERQAEQLAMAAPKIDFADRVAGVEKGVLIGNFAKSVGIGPRKIFDILRNEKILMTGGNRHNLPFQEYMDRGYFEVREGTFDNHGETRISFTPLITGKGQQWLTTKMIDKGYLKAVAAIDNGGAV